MAIFGAYGLVPLAIIAEKVTEPAVRWIKRMFEERQIAGGEIRSQ